MSWSEELSNTVLMMPGQGRSNTTSPRANLTNFYTQKPHPVRPSEQWNITVHRSFTLFNVYIISNEKILNSEITSRISLTHRLVSKMIFILIFILCTNYLVKSKNVLLIIADDAGLEVNCKKFHENVVHCIIPSWKRYVFYSSL